VAHLWVPEVSPATNINFTVRWGEVFHSRGNMVHVPQHCSRTQALLHCCASQPMADK